MNLYLLKYLLIGLGFAAVVEGINLGVLQGNWSGMLATLFGFYSFFIFLGYAAVRTFDRTFNGVVLSFVGMGLLGLVGFEWIIIGAHPTIDQSWLTILIFQLGMFSYWTGVGVIPYLLLDEEEAVYSVKKRLILFIVIWYSLVYLIGLNFLFGALRFGFMQLSSALGSILLLRYMIEFLRIKHRSLSPGPVYWG